MEKASGVQSEQTAVIFSDHCATQTFIHLWRGVGCLSKLLSLVF